MPGEKVTITAGVGAYSTAAQPQITIGGAPVRLMPMVLLSKNLTQMVVAKEAYR
ncbi:MAG: hypothetical protein IPI88_01905 [Chitinophagaceae bacterium]|nr:hypothetical protein [Chitinophagaceae bacterium]